MVQVEAGLFPSRLRVQELATQVLEKLEAGKIQEAGQAITELEALDKKTGVQAATEPLLDSGTNSRSDFVNDKVLARHALARYAASTGEVDKAESYYRSALELAK